MKTIPECKRACFYNVDSAEVVYILSYEFNTTLSDNDIACMLFNPNTMEEAYGYFWLKNTALRMEIYTQYKEVCTWIDKIKKWFK